MTEPLESVRVYLVKINPSNADNEGDFEKVVPVHWEHSE